MSSPISTPTLTPLSSGVRAFFVVLFGLFGLLAACLLLLLFIALLKGSSEPLDREYKIELLADANGVRKPIGKRENLILTVEIEGQIGLEHLTTKRMERLLVESQEGELKGRIKGLLLRIRSGGGTAVDSEGIYHALKIYKERYNLPIYTFIDGMANSGGYMIAVAGDKIYATKSALVGSVGVLLPTIFNFSDLLKSLKVGTANLSSGKNKDLLNPTRAWKKDEEAIIQALLDDNYRIFLELVSSQRPKLTETLLQENYGAGVFPATTAMEYGYIDDLCDSHETCLSELVAAAKIDDEEYRVISLQAKPSLVDWLSARSAIDLVSALSDQLKITSQGLPLLK